MRLSKFRHCPVDFTLSADVVHPHGHTPEFFIRSRHILIEEFNPKLLPGRLI